MMEKLSVLIVDDEQRVLDEIEEFLSKKDYNVVTASCATDAYKILEKTGSSQKRKYRFKNPLMKAFIKLKMHE